MSVYGNVYGFAGTEEADYPSVNAVLEGVTFDNGAKVGTVVLPAIGDVRLTVRYGAGGTQFTGSLFVRPTARSAWRDERLIAFLDECEEWGVTISRNGSTATATKTPDVVDRMMQATSYLTDTRSTFSILATDWTRLGLGSRVQFACDGVNFEIIKYRDDSADSIITFDGVKLK